MSLETLVPRRDQPVPPAGMESLSKELSRWLPSPVFAYFQWWGAHSLPGSLSHPLDSSA